MRLIAKTFIYLPSLRATMLDSKKGYVLEKNSIVIQRDLTELDIFAKKFLDILKKHTNYLVVSGFVSICTGRTRGTEDIDMIIPRLSIVGLKKLHSDLVKNNFVCMQSENTEEIFKYFKDNLSVRYTYKDKPLPEMELKFSKDELDELQLKTKTKLPLTGLDVWFSSINMNIAFKEEYLKSDKDLEDAKHLRTVYDEIVDEKEIKHIKELIRKWRL